ncbi:MAG TPA: hypothetical protein VFG32_10515 [Bacteroidota bacterium]|nr:hypothetical protein [Bacteroidota bacterium]
MSYKIRNSVVLGVLLFLVLGVGVYVRGFNLPGKLNKIETEIRTIEDQLQNTPNLVAEFNDLSANLADTKKRWENRNKDIPPVDVTSQTYAYFSRLIDLSGDVKLDLLYTGVEQKGNYGFNVYNLRGEAPFENFYRFIWYLENGRKLYKIKKMNVKGLEIAPKEDEPGGILVTFEMVVHAYFSSVAELASAPGERTITPNYLMIDPFNPVISSDIPANLRKLIEIERSDLKAVIPGKAFVLDQTNAFRTLTEGDEVYLGYVTKIDPELGRIECTLNKGGIIEKVELKIRYGIQQNVVQK